MGTNICIGKCNQLSLRFGGSGICLSTHKYNYRLMGTLLFSFRGEVLLLHLY